MRSSPIDLPSNDVNTSILSASNSDDSDKSIFPSNVTNGIIPSKDRYNGIYLPPPCMVDLSGDVSNASILIESNSNDSDIYKYFA